MQCFAIQLYSFKQLCYKGKVKDPSQGTCKRKRIQEFLQTKLILLVLVSSVQISTTKPNMNRTNRILGNGRPSKNGSPSFVPICVQCTVCSDTNARKFQGKCAAHPRIICFNEKPILKSEFSSMWRAVKTELIPGSISILLLLKFPSNKCSLLS